MTNRDSINLDLKKNNTIHVYIIMFIYVKCFRHYLFQQHHNQREIKKNLEKEMPQKITID